MDGDQQGQHGGENEQGPGGVPLSRQGRPGLNEATLAEAQKQQGPGGISLSRQRRPGLNEVTIAETQKRANHNFSVLSRRLSAERLAPYRVATGSAAAALALYEWNAEVSAAWWGVVSHIEVLLRNAMHNELTKWSTRRFGDPRWYLDPGRVLSSEAIRSIATARVQAGYYGRPELPSRVITELSFGFWRFLLTARYERTLWRSCLYKALPGQGLRSQAHDGFQRLHGLRNRIAHHEPIHNRPLEALHKTALITAGWICPDTALWIGSRSRVPLLLRQRP